MTSNDEYDYFETLHVDVIKTFQENNPELVVRALHPHVASFLEQTKPTLRKSTKQKRRIVI
jgi:hypothetical protein